MSGALPEPERQAAWWAETEATSRLDFGLAITPEDFDGAFRLLHDRYVWRRFMAVEPSRRRLNAHNFLPTTKVFVARAADRVVATVTVVEDSRLGLPVDEALGADLGRLRARGRRVGEAGSLAVDAAYRAHGAPILVRLYRPAVLYAAAIARLDDLAFVVRPRHRAFYLTLLPFREFRGTRRYRRLDGASVIGLRLDLALVRALVRTEAAGFSAGPRTRFLCGPETYGELMARLRRELPRSALTPVEWAELLARHGPAGPSAVERSPVELGALIAAQCAATPEGHA